MYIHSISSPINLPAAQGVCSDVASADLPKLLSVRDLIKQGDMPTGKFPILGRLNNSNQI